ncbi:Ankyrin repeat-containing protein ITN1 [Camellia lanceoleosa]|uniref:Ankyrin repeat-containing protein ITN1 n=1 Tax=Camellia lanceoleosa TaxID=1840588 RepID=A0ACC0HE15_9ERIC|nr:Ankyrin repeat-containing protein ITN1 [Camellia lanceoleosa]
MEGGIQNGPEIQIVTSPQLIAPSCDLLSREARDQYLAICLPLYQAALKGDWKAANGVIEILPTVIRSSITKGWETALHIAAAAKRIHFVEELVGLMNPEDLELQNSNGNTALCFAAAAGTVRIAEVMINKNERLPMICGSQGMTPLYMAALLGHSVMVWYLYQKTKSEDLSDEDRIGILNTCVSTDLYDVALDILKHHPQLAVARDGNGETALHPEPKHISRCRFTSSCRNMQILYEIGSIKDLITAYRDEDCNNMLHLAAKIAPPNQLNIVSGAALQMQRELLWFKEVEKIMQPSHVEKKNSKGKTPRALFTEEHKDLIEKGEAWMKNTASQSMVVNTYSNRNVCCSFYCTRRQ